ncbi:hypothetical protein VTK26DRAFT_5273 [Humicola hyalothermophila]
MGSRLAENITDHVPQRQNAALMPQPGTAATSAGRFFQRHGTLSLDAKRAAASAIIRLVHPRQSESSISQYLKGSPLAKAQTMTLNLPSPPACSAASPQSGSTDPPTVGNSPG